MRTLRFPWTPGAALAAAAGLAALLPVLIAVEAWRAGERHRAAAERALEAHAEFAASTLRQRVIGFTYASVSRVLAPVGNARTAQPPGPLPELAALRGAADSARACRDCQTGPEADWFFRLSYETGSLDVMGRAPTAEHASWLRAELADLGPLRTARDWDHASLPDTLRPGGGVVYLTVRRGPDGLPRAAYGFGVSLQSLKQQVLRPALDGPPLLPLRPSAAAANDSVLAVALTAPGGGPTVVPLSPRTLPATYAAELPGGVYLGGWTIRLQLDPAAAPALLIGGLPPRRAGVLAALVLLTAALVATTAWLAHRAWVLARVREEFVAGVSHELRTPLAQILLFAETISLGRMRDRADLRAAGDIIAAEARRLMQLVDNVLRFGRSTRGDPGAPPGPALPLAPLVRETVAGFAALAAAAGATVRIVRADDVAAPIDPAGLRQVLLNLLDNAVKYGPRGQGVTVSLARRDATAVLEIEDEGPGVPAADRERVWEPFVRVERELESHAAGSGIGLAVVRQIVARHGGRCRLESADRSSGTRVVIEFPGAAPVAGEVACAS